MKHRPVAPRHHDDARGQHHAARAAPPRPGATSWGGRRSVRNAAQGQHAAARAQRPAAPRHHDDARGQRHAARAERAQPRPGAASRGFPATSWGEFRGVDGGVEHALFGRVGACAEALHFQDEFLQAGYGVRVRV